MCLYYRRLLSQSIYGPIIVSFLGEDVSVFILFIYKLQQLNVGNCNIDFFNFVHVQA